MNLSIPPRQPGDTSALCRSSAHKMGQPAQLSSDNRSRTGPISVSCSRSATAPSQPPARWPRPLRWNSSRRVQRRVRPTSSRGRAAMVSVRRRRMERCPSHGGDLTRRWTRRDWSQRDQCHHLGLGYDIRPPCGRSASAAGNPEGCQLLAGGRSAQRRPPDGREERPHPGRGCQQRPVPGRPPRTRSFGIRKPELAHPCLSWSRPA